MRLPAITCTLKSHEVGRRKNDFHVGFDRIEAQVSDMAVSLPSMHSSDNVMGRLLLQWAGVAVGLFVGRADSISFLGAISHKDELLTKVS